MATLSARMENWLKDEIVSFWREHGEGPSSGLRRVAEEWWAMQKFPAIAFRDGVSGRRAVLRRGPDVWEVALVARDYGDDQEGFYEHFGDSVERDALEQAVAYTECFTEEIDAMIAGNERVARLLRSRDAA